MEYFRRDNTESFSMWELDQLNSLFEAEMASHDEDDPMIDNIRKNVGDRILQAFGTRDAR